MASCRPAALSRWLCRALPGRSSFALIRGPGRCGLRLDEARERLILTFPAADEPANRARLGAGAKRDWVEAQLARLQPGEPFRARRRRSRSRAARSGCTGRKACRARPRFRWRSCRCGGPEAGLCRPDRALPARRSAAPAERGNRRDAPDRAGVSVNSVAVGDASSRWGSCSSSGAIRYNWRLVLAPPHLLRWVVGA